LAHMHGLIPKLTFNVLGYLFPKFENKINCIKKRLENNTIGVCNPKITS